jgi:hypothetical protein
MRPRDAFQFLFRFRKRDIQEVLTRVAAGPQELHREGGLADAWIPSNEIQAIAR